MCGIWGFVPFDQLTPGQVQKIFESFMRVQVRGPDRSDFKEINEFNKIFLGFHRLAIMDRSTYGDQPFTVEPPQRSVYAICNGEIYNFHQLISEYELASDLKSGSDCEILPHLYVRLGFEPMLRRLRGEFAICIVDIDHVDKKIELFIGRDPIAVRPVFIGYDQNGFAFSSILAGIASKSMCLVEPSTIRQLEGGKFVHLTLQEGRERQFDEKSYYTLDAVGIDTSGYLHSEITVDAGGLSIPHQVLHRINTKFTEAVKIRLESDRPIGALLSGGLDSSLVVSIAAAHLKKQKKRLRTFSIGIPGSTDKEFAEMVAKHCGTDHTHVEFCEKDFLDAIPEVVQAIESYDTTSVRASVGQFLISRWIKENTDIRVLLIGDGSDELCSGYMYFHNAPSPLESHQENVRLVKYIPYYDSLRADRCIAYNGIEARVPFLDHEFVDLYLSIPYEFRVPIKDSVTGRRTEKWLLRKSFEGPNMDMVVYKDTDSVIVESYLPDQVLWRKKEAFSDGVSSRKRSWYQIIQESLESIYTEDDFKDPDVNYHMSPQTKESLHYRKLFNSLFHPRAGGVIPFYWMPKWSGDVKDPSARVLAVYDE